MKNWSIRKYIGACILASTIAVTLTTSYLHVFEKPTVFSVAFYRGEHLEDGMDVVIQQAANLLRDKPYRAKIVGFSKQGNDADADMELSINRANDVAAILTSKGIDANRLTVIGKGSSVESTPRVDIVIQK
jgi:flagellar motor protein MotB